MLLAPAAAIYLLLVGVLLPFLAVRSAQRLKRSGYAFPPRVQLFLQTMFVMVLLGILAIVTARSIGILQFLFATQAPTARDLGAAALALLLLLGWAPIGWRMRTEERKRRLLALLPTNTRERVLWVALTAAAGYFEEIIYRGVLFSIVLYLTRNWWAAAILCSGVFALVHAVQGLRSAVQIGIVALLFHGLVRVTGTLCYAMVVHFLYDLIVGLVIGNLPRAPAAAPPTATA